jgi:hypothetical protein
MTDILARKVDMSAATQEMDIHDDEDLPPEVKELADAFKQIPKSVVLKLYKDNDKDAAATLDALEAYQVSQSQD